MAVIPAAGTVPWRRTGDVLEVAMVHRPRYDDWSWPKGKLDPGEDWLVAAVRETFEETGLHVRVGTALPPAAYTVLDRDGSPATKEVRYWAAQVSGGHGRLVNEIDEVAWVDVATAYDRLDYARDRDQLFAVVRAHQDGTLQTRPVAVIRHAKAVPRSGWKGHDPLRPLDDAGERRSADIASLLAAYGVDRVVSSPSVRCVDTVRPYATQLGRRIRLRDGLSEEGYAADPSVAVQVAGAEVRRGRATALCSHGPVLPDILATLAGHTTPADDDARDLLRAAAEDGMGKGEVLIAHVIGAKRSSRIVAVERHLP